MSFKHTSLFRATSHQDANPTEDSAQSHPSNVRHGKSNAEDARASQSASASTTLDARELKARADFLAIASRYTRLRHTGRQYVGLCPFHSERHPSFYVEPTRKIWKCFGCGAGGDLFAFIMLAENCDFVKALRMVAELLGVARDSEPRSGSRFGASEGGLPLSLPKAGVRHSQFSQDSRARILAALEATNRGFRAIEVTNAAASAALATACEPDRNSGVWQIHKEAII